MFITLENIQYCPHLQVAGLVIDPIDLKVQLYDCDPDDVLKRLEFFPNIILAPALLNACNQTLGIFEGPIPYIPTCSITTLNIDTIQTLFDFRLFKYANYWEWHNAQLKTFLDALCKNAWLTFAGCRLADQAYANKWVKAIWEVYYLTNHAYWPFLKMSVSPETVGYQIGFILHSEPNMSPPLFLRHEAVIEKFLSQNMKPQRP